MLDRIVDGDDNRVTTGEVTRPAGLPIYGQVYDEYTPRNEELYGFRRDFEREVPYGVCPGTLRGVPTLGASSSIFKS